MGNKTIQVIPLKFPSWEEFQKQDMVEGYSKQFGYYIKKSHGNGRSYHGYNSIQYKCTQSFSEDCMIPYTPEGYEQACEEIRKVRFRIATELAKGE